MSAPYRLAYLVSQYPAISHTFILREVLGLRARGFAINVASVNPPDRPPEKLTADERREAEATWYLKPQGAAGALKALCLTALRRPSALVGGLWFALRLGGTDAKKLGYQFAYWVEAIMLGDWMRREGLSHLHVHFATPASMVGLIAGKVFPIGFSFTVHGPDEFYDAPGYRLAEKIAGADFVVCISHYARSQLMKLSPVTHWNKFEVCRLGVDPSRFALRESRSAGSVFELLCVGRLGVCRTMDLLGSGFLESRIFRGHWRGSHQRFASITRPRCAPPPPWRLYWCVTLGFYVKPVTLPPTRASASD
ncbi:glycosyltransferase [Methylococcus sp. Mc7]|uniref:glycosyltransferase n=1 Tax=Methylococcus sp. Mc7 TaxID=2860258 RepID=UPI002105A566|nr:glycosyltransferase [Methylococcus sp. Mc7]